MRWCVERGEFGEVRTLASQMRFNRPLYDAIGMARAAIWPVVEALIPRNDAPLENLLTQLVHREPEHFGRLASLAPDLAARVAGQLALWKQVSLAPFAGALWSIYVGGAPSAGAALKQAAAQATPLPELLPKMEARLSEASGAEAALLAWVITLEQLKQGRELDLLQERRPEVRRAALQALGTKYAAHWERFLLAVSSSDDEAMLELARAGIEEGHPFDAAMGKRFADRPAFLSFVATRYPALRRELGLPEVTATRACAVCRGLPREKFWGQASEAPGLLSGLQRVASLEQTDTSSFELLRCPECWAHFLLREVEVLDVNSRHESASLRRLKLSELQEHYREHFDASHPRVASWNEALRADLHHLEPAVRANAEWELGS